MKSYTVTVTPEDTKVKDEKVPDDMAELQATIELSVEMNRFYNVDLFQRGYYQVHTVLKTPPKCPARVEISDNKINAQRGGSPENAAVFKQSSMGRSQKFQILYRNEEVDIGDIFIYRIHMLVDSTKLEKNLENLDLKLEIQLWCNDEDEGTDSEAKMELASTRTLQLHLSPTKGLHHSLPVLFDYFHLSAVELVIHGTIIAIHQPYLTMPKSQKTARSSDQSTLEAVYFGQKIATPPPSNQSSSSARLQQAHLMHKTICNILLSAHESLQENLEQFAAKIPDSHFRLARKDCHTRLGEAVMKVQGVLEEEDLIQTAITDITQLCAENVILWAQFLEIVLRQPHVHLHLAKEHHSQRIRRFGEGFFTLEHNKSSCLSCYDPGVHGHTSLASLVKNSPYFCNLPSLSVECTELDGDTNSLPVIFEDIYHDARAPPPQAYQKAVVQTVADGSVTGSPRQRSSSNSSSSLASERGTSPSVRKRSSTKKFIKNMKPEGFKRPSSYYCSEAEAAQAKADNVSTPPAGVTLIGYRKIPIPDTVPSAAVHLGTFSPDSPDITLSGSLASLENRSSGTFSSLLPTACMNRGSEESLANLSTEAVGGSNSSISQPATTTSAEASSKARDKSHSSPDRSSSVLTPAPVISILQSPSVSIKQSSCNDSSTTVTSKPPIPPTNRDSMTSISTGSKSTNISVPSDSHSIDTGLAKLSKDDYSNLAEGISQALGEKESASSKIISAITSSNDDDFSDDDTNIANGYDDVLDAYREDFSSSQPSDNSTSTLTVIAKTSRSHSPQSQGPSPADRYTDTPQTPDSKNNDSALGSEISSQEEISSSPSAMATQTAQSISTLTTTTQASTAPTSPNKAASTPAANIRYSYTDPKHKVTVIELLKEEYRRSLKTGGQESPVVDPTAIVLTSAVESGPFSGHRAASDSDILKNCEEEERNSHRESQETQLSKTNIDGGEKRRVLLSSSSSYPELSHAAKADTPRLVSVIGHHTVNFVQLRESLKLQMNFPGYLYSECPTLASTIPYFQVPPDVEESGAGIHLIVCVHGLDGNSADLRLVRTYIEMALPGYRLEFLMSERNQQDTFADFDKMTDRLVDEILSFMDTFGFHITRISFVGHSLGNIIIRSTLARPKMANLLPKLYTLLSLSGPHLGTLYNTSGLVNMGMWFMQKWKKSGSLLQLSLKDHTDPRQTFLYRLSQKPVLQNFKHVLLVGSHQDRYVPYHSSRIEICKSAQKDSSITGAVYREMVQNILEPIIQSPHCTLIRYDVFHALPSTANTMIGRAAHIAVLDSEIFIEKFLTVTGLKYFQ